MTVSKSKYDGIACHIFKPDVPSQHALGFYKITFFGVGVSVCVCTCVHVHVSVYLCVCLSF